MISATEEPTTRSVFTLSYNESTTWWNTTQIPSTDLVTNATPTFFSTQTESYMTTENFTTIVPEITTIPIYVPMCVANLSGECESCIRDAFFWTRNPNDTETKDGEKNMGWNFLQ